jgi:hypothetical protein
MAGGYVVCHFHLAPCFWTALDIGSTPRAHWYSDLTALLNLICSLYSRRISEAARDKANTLYAVLNKRVPGFNIKMNKYQTNRTYQQKKKAIISSVSTCIERIYALALTLLSSRRVPRLFGATPFGTSRTMVPALSLWSLAIRLTLKKDSPNAKVVDFGKRSLVASSFQSLSANTSM